ncbi:MAG: hypothetical protein EAZ60_08585 [Oscillatoriales cyanobacterium]|nr:MAG: hypothetical protein EAZ83_14320 [Oscillatoriales cyanobacterium]TAE97722.1 MAG: hypothetical protein EAZ79_09900 [Oscillatoriales cyanobacterium]TAF19186.1 MAG: hypothetical protein EAZ73_15990 [Oscillatoriales cyanobacterium]TAF27631.1 MAG: hypothetical protein EAZ69_27785 [Oscillatoriales cyanobacterium]TAF56842.1 MAG: hypothetical protein EAZ60_08585 [Oscillatoriales cyanobacterium]
MYAGIEKLTAYISRSTYLMANRYDLLARGTERMVPRAAFVWFGLFQAIALCAVKSPQKVKYQSL